MAFASATTGAYVSTSASVPTGDVTACFWYKRATNAAGGSVVWGIGGNTYSGTDAYLMWFSTYANALQFYGPSGGLIATGVVATMAGWDFMAAVGNTGKSQAWAVWQNSTKNTGTSSSSGTYASGPVDLGGSPDNATLVLNGAIAGYKQWTVKLTDAEVEAERWSYRPQKWANLWTWAPLLHTGNLSDYSGQGRGFTATGSVTTDDGPPIAWQPRQPRTWGEVTAVAAAGGIVRQMLQHAG